MLYNCITSTVEADTEERIHLAHSSGNSPSLRAKSQQLEFGGAGNSTSIIGNSNECIHVQLVLSVSYNPGSSAQAIILPIMGISSHFN